jgi:2TM domain-containing protein
VDHTTRSHRSLGVPGPSASSTTLVPGAIDHGLCGGCPGIRARAAGDCHRFAHGEILNQDPLHPGLVQRRALLRNLWPEARRASGPRCRAVEGRAGGSLRAGHADASPVSAARHEGAERFPQANPCAARLPRQGDRVPGGVASHERPSRCCRDRARESKPGYEQLRGDVILHVVNFTASSDGYWAARPLLGWGFGLLAHASATYRWLPFCRDGWAQPGDGNGHDRTDAAFVPGDILLHDCCQIWRAPGVVRYHKNGKLIYRSTVAPECSLRVRRSLLSLYATISNAVISNARGRSRQEGNHAECDP